MEDIILRKFFFSLFCLLFLLFPLTMFYYDLIFFVPPVLAKNEVLNVTKNSVDFNSNNIMRGVWFSYLDWFNLVDVSVVNGEVDSEKFKKNVELICDNLSSIGINNLFLHVRAFGDAFYPSNLVYRSKFLKNINFDKIDPLKIFISCAKNHKIKVHGWMNPMRVLSEKDFDFIPDKFEIKKWFDDEKLRNDHFVGLDSYKCWVLNPCNDEVIDLIVSAEHELLKKYDLDGIHIDDYFFPVNLNKTKFDYFFYKKKQPECNIDSFRFKGTNKLVEKMRNKCHELKPSAVFGVAVIGNFIVNKSQYIDIEYWIKNGLVDYLIPEIYYSFQNRLMPFDRCVQEWSSLIDKYGSKLKLFVGLAAYRIGEAPQKSDAGWCKESDDILKKQQIYCKNNLKNYCGYCLFDYRSIFDKKGNRKQVCSKEIENLNSCFES